MLKQILSGTTIIKAISNMSSVDVFLKALDNATEIAEEIADKLKVINEQLGELNE